MRRRGDPALVPVEDSRVTAGPHVALVPGEAAMLLQLEMPEGLRGIARERVARRQAADRLGLAPEAIDVRLLSETGGAALVVDPDTAEAWRQAVRGSACVAMLPDYLTLVAGPGIWTLHVADGRLLARLGDEDGFAAEMALARLQIARALAVGRPDAVLRTGAPAPEIDALLSDAEVPSFADLDGLAAAGHPRPEPPRWEQSTADLLQSPNTDLDRVRASVRRWRIPVLLAALALALWVADMALRIDRARKARDALMAETTEIVRETFVPNGPLLDIRAQVARRATELTEAATDTNDASPLGLLRRVAPALQASDVRLREVSYRDDTALEIAVAADDFAAVEALARSIRDDGIAVDVVDALADGAGGVLARLRVGETS